VSDPLPPLPPYPPTRSPGYDHAPANHLAPASHPAPLRPTRHRVALIVGAAGLVSACLAGAAIAAYQPARSEGSGARHRPVAAPQSTAPATGADPGTSPVASVPRPALRLRRLQLPDSFRDLSRADDMPLAQQVAQSVQGLANPGEKEDTAAYADNPSSPLQLVFAVSIESPVDFSSPEARLNQLLQINDVSAGGGQVTSTPPEDVDPGSLGGLMRCLASATRFESGGSQTSEVIMTCGWVKGNVAGLVMTPNPTGPEPETTAQLARDLREAAESVNR